ncbi:hypothetical protein I7I53_05320 [Histoplasma capsulatum var. duboisii H88]|uniref:Uncharacterized protein n=1 Tax=Ajellomyces capsulatus (strain H88) TaxID=544711 RepID=A0A8A1LXQ8_AJEC8|nr:hypothetical protein I7I53_05320 [Histoplasma capsulatum var. duboisii H88]
MHFQPSSKAFNSLNGRARKGSVDVITIIRLDPPAVQVRTGISIAALTALEGQFKAEGGHHLGGDENKKVPGGDKTKGSSFLGR